MCVACLGTKPYAQLGPRAKTNRLTKLRNAIKWILADDEVQLQRSTVGGYTLVGGCMTTAVGVGEQWDAVEREAISVIRRAREQRMSFRQMYKQSRNCTRQDLRRVVRSLLPYKGYPLEVSPARARARRAGVADLVEVVKCQLRIAEALGVKQIRTNAIMVILCVDATPLWRASATWCDVYVDIWGGPEAAGDMGRWATWWALDGSDDAHLLRTLRNGARLREQVDEVQRELTWGVYR